METRTFLRIVDRYLEGAASEGEILLLENYYKRLADQTPVPVDLAQLLQTGKTIFTNIEREIKWKENPRLTMKSERFSAQLIDGYWEEGHEQAPFKEGRKAKVYKLWYKISIAAVVLIVASFSVFHLNIFNNEEINYVRDIAIGKQAATLTLSNGKKIPLSDAVNGTLATDAGVIISKTGDGQIVYHIRENDGGPSKLNTLSTANGETFMVVMPDLSKVWLNAASSLTFPTKFKGNSREVFLTGEAYFEVAHQAQMPFTVHTKAQEVEVLGTHFNIMDYGDDPNTKTTLLTGSVKVRHGREFSMLRPGEESVLIQGEITIKKADLNGAVAWKNGYFRFNNTNIKEVMDELSRWYNIEVSYEGKMPEEGFTGKISRYKNISQVLNMLLRTKAVHFKVEGRRVSVKI